LGRPLRCGWLMGSMGDWPLALPWAPGATPRSDTDVSAGPGPASYGPGAGPSLVSPACQDAKLEDVEGLPVGRLHTARQLRRYPRPPGSRKYRNSLLTHPTQNSQVRFRQRRDWVPRPVKKSSCQASKRRPAGPPGAGLEWLSGQQHRGDSGRGGRQPLRILARPGTICSIGHGPGMLTAPDQDHTQVLLLGPGRPT
jgi:hypothetical protein